MNQTKKTCECQPNMHQDNPTPNDTPANANANANNDICAFSRLVPPTPAITLGQYLINKRQNQVQEQAKKESAQAQFISNNQRSAFMNTFTEFQTNVGIAAINLGYGYTKISLDGAEDTFMSVISSQQRSIGAEGDKPNLLNIVHSDGETFEVGMKAAVQSWQEPHRLISSRWGRSRHYRLLSQAVLNRMAFSGKKRWRIITGLAAEHYQDEAYRQDVAGVWRGANSLHSTPFGTIEIVSVNVVPETVGGFMSLLSDPAMNQKMQSLEGAVVDFGTMTTNWLPFKGGRPQTNGFQSIDCGVFKVMEAATKSLRVRALPRARSVDLESAYLDINPLSIMSRSPSGAVETQQLDVSSDIQESALKVWPQIEIALRNNLGDAQGKLFLGIGGGVKVFGELFSKSFSDAVCMFTGSAQMENVRGLYLMAKSHGQRETSS